MNNKSGSEQEPSWHKYCRQVMAFLNMSETTDTEYPYRCLAPIDETVKNMKAERIGKQIDRLIKEETYHLQKLCEKQGRELSWYKESCRKHEEWREQFTARGKDLDAENQRVHGCICPTPDKKADGTYDWKLSPECVYHATALKYPSNHSIPWNCPTYWDGCNCSEYYDKQDTLRSQLAEQKGEIERLKRQVEMTQTKWAEDLVKEGRVAVLMAQLAEQTERVRRLEKALNPFCNYVSYEKHKEVCNLPVDSKTGRCLHEDARQALNQDSLGDGK